MNVSELCATYNIYIGTSITGASLMLIRCQMDPFKTGAYVQSLTEKHLHRKDLTTYMRP